MVFGRKKGFLVSFQCRESRPRRMYVLYVLFTRGVFFNHTKGGEPVHPSHTIDQFVPLV